MAKPILVILSLISLSAGLLVDKRAAPRELKVLTPRSGDNIVSGDRNFQFNITWQDISTEFNASIALRQGDAESNLPQVALIAATTFNNGSYLWSYRNDMFLRRSRAASACNYSIEISAGGDRALSEYFTIQNADDEGVPINSTCPSGTPFISTTNTPVEKAAGCGARKCYSAAMLGGAVAAVAALFVILLAIALLLKRWRARHRAARSVQGPPTGSPAVADPWAYAGDEPFREGVKEAPLTTVERAQLPATERRTAQLPANHDGS